MTILYFHGLDSALSPEKRQILEKFGSVIAPNVEYRNRPNAIAELLAAYQNQSIDVVIGSSMGGFVGYYVSQSLDVSALLFNPALPYRSVTMIEPDLIPKGTAYCEIHVGQLDTVVNAQENIDYIKKKVSRPNLELILKPNLAHQIPVDVFEEAVAGFMARI